MIQINRLNACIVLLMGFAPLCNAGDDPELVKTKLRHWAQAVACSVMQSSGS